MLGRWLVLKVVTAGSAVARTGMRGGTTQVASPKDLSGAFGAVPALGQPGPAGIHLPDGAELRVLPYQLGYGPDDVLDQVPARGGHPGRHLRAGRPQVVGRCQARVDRGHVAPAHSAGPQVSGRWGQLNLLGERHWVKKRFHAEITAADAEAGFTYRR